MSQNEDTLRTLLDLCNRHDAAAIQAHLADDMRFVNPISGESDASGMYAMHSALFTGFPDVVYRLDRMLTQDDSVVLECTISGTQQGEFMGIPASGKTINLTAAFCVDMAGGKVKDWRSYFDSTTIMRQLGQLPTPAEAAAATA
jgi:steroid delta-isomerase-like uncharacterized protein